MADACIEEVALGAVLQQVVIHTSPGDILVDSNRLRILTKLSGELSDLHTSKVIPNPGDFVPSSAGKRIMHPLRGQCLAEWSLDLEEKSSLALILHLLASDVCSSPAYRSAA